MQVCTYMYTYFY